MNRGEGSDAPTRPGGALAARPLHLVWMLDTSGSMADDGKIQALNNAIRETIPHLRDVGTANPHAQVFVRVLTFSTGARWHVAEPQPVQSFVWRDVEASGYTDVGAALELAAGAITATHLDHRAFPPVLVLVADGQATDDFERGLARLLAEPWGQRAVRLAIAIGRDADTTMLRRFSSPDTPVLAANNPEQLVRMLRFASTAAARSASVGTSPDRPRPRVEIPVLNPEALDATW